VRDVQAQAGRLRGALRLHQAGTPRLPHRVHEAHAESAPVHLQVVLARTAGRCRAKGAAEEDEESANGCAGEIVHIQENRG